MSITLDCFSVNMVSSELPQFALIITPLTLRQFRQQLQREDAVLWQSNMELFRKFCPKSIADDVEHTSFAHHEFSYGDVIYVISAKYNDRSTCVFKRIVVVEVDEEPETYHYPEEEECDKL